MKRPPIKPLVLVGYLLLVRSISVWAAVQEVAPVSETFTYEPGPQAPFYLEGAGWEETKQRGWNMIPGKQMSRDEINVIGKGSLEYQDADGKKFPAQGNRLLNGMDAPMRAARLIDVALPAFNDLRLDAAGGMPPNDERGHDGLGKGTLWFSMLIQPNDGALVVRLQQNIYNMSPSGVDFSYDPKTGELTCGQLWYTVKRGEVSANVSLSDPNKPTWVVAKIVFGDSWGADDPAQPLNATLPMERPSPNGRLLVWLNPKLGEEPKEAEAAVNVHLHEFRINNFYSLINPGASLDEIRFGTTFQQVNH
jgi:hypothetical protein